MRAQVARWRTSATTPPSKRPSPWHKPWDTSHGRPRNLVSRRPYNGVNALTLGLTGRRPYWLTMRQVNSMGFRVRKGSKGVPILYAKKSALTEIRTENTVAGHEVNRERFLMRLYYVFNADDVDGLKIEEKPRQEGGVPAAQAILDAVQPRPDLRTGAEAFFAPGPDQVVLPPKESFRRAVDYYATAFHELTHWTGHPLRLNRGTLTTAAPFGSRVYSQEELVAEMGAGFLCALAGIENYTIDQSASYVDHWLKALRADPGRMVRAAAQAQRAVDFVVPNKADNAPQARTPDGVAGLTRVPDEMGEGVPG